MNKLELLAVDMKDQSFIQKIFGIKKYVINKEWEKRRIGVLKIIVKDLENEMFSKTCAISGKNCNSDCIHYSKSTINNPNYEYFLGDHYLSVGSANSPICKLWRLGNDI